MGTPAAHPFRTISPVQCHPTRHMTSSLIDRARNYLATMPPSIQGSGGGIAAFKAAVVAVRGFNLPDDESLGLLLRWNTACLPPWLERELLAKIKSAHRQSRKPYGYLLGDNDRPTGKTSPGLPPPPQPRRGYDPAELAQKASLQAAFPDPRQVTKQEQGTIARLRSTPLAAVGILSQNGRLMADDTRPGCFLLTDGRTDGRGHRQYRNLDGSPFYHGQKSDNAKGSAGKGFFSLSHDRRLDPDELIFISEGTISLLETVSIQWLCEGRARRWHFLAAHSAASTFAAEPALLRAIAGHHCRILPDPGKAGTIAARAWGDELRAVGCQVDFAKMPDGFQDLRFILTAGTDGVAAARSILQYPSLARKGWQT